MTGLFSISEAFSIALHLSLRLARQPESYCSTRAVAESFGFSVHHVAKVVQKLVHAGILETVRGIQGGARLARPADGMTLMDIAEALGETPPEGCLLHKTVCEGHNCLLGRVIVEQNARLRAVLQETTLQTLADSLVTGAAPSPAATTGEHDVKRKIVEIDEAKCTGCGLCIAACHEGALQLIDGKAKLVTDSYCDGLGACLPACPADAIRIIEREAAAFDEAQVAAAQAQAASHPAPAPAAPEKLACGCPGTMARTITPKARTADTPSAAPAPPSAVPPSSITTWPIQIKLVPVNAPYFKDASLLIAADCTGYAAADFNARFMKGRVTLIGCPKLDEGDYSEKLTAILQANEIRRLTVVRMEVPCCAGIVNAVKQALANSGKLIPWQVVTLGVDGTVLEE